MGYVRKSVQYDLPHVFVPGQKEERERESWVDGKGRICDKIKGSVGRPRIRTADMLRAIGEKLKMGLSYKHACAAVGMNYNTFLRWKVADPRITEYLESCKALGANELVKALYEKATIERDTRAIIFLLERSHGYTSRNSDLEQLARNPALANSPEVQTELNDNEKRELARMLMANESADSDLNPQKQLSSGDEPKPTGPIIAPETRTYSPEDLAENGPVTIDNSDGTITDTLTGEVVNESDVG